MKNSQSSFNTFCVFTFILSTMVACGGGGSDDPDDPVIPNSAPTVSSVTIQGSSGAGDALAGDTLTGEGDYSDTENDPQGTHGYRWLLDGVAITGATSTTYVVLESERGHEITFEFTPVASSGTATGSPVTSGGLTVNSLPTATEITITDANDGSPIVGDLFEADYEFSDDDNDLESGKVFQWLRDGVAIDGETSNSYTIVAEDSGSEISFNATPSAATGELTGDTVPSPSILILNSAPLITSVVIEDTNGDDIALNDSLEAVTDFVDIDLDLDASTYQWMRDGVDIADATNKTYSVTKEDSETELSVQVVALSNQGTNPGPTVVSEMVLIADIALPTVVSTEPVDAATDIDLDAVISAVFSESMTESSINDASFTLTQNGNSIPVAVTYDEQTKTATSTPSESLTHLTKYDVSLTNAMTDISGNALENYDWSFTTRDRRWLEAELIEAEEGDLFGYDLAFFNNGDAIAVWAQTDGIRYNIWSNTYIKGQGWQSAQLIENNNFGHAGTNGSTDFGIPKIATDGTENAMVVWAQIDENEQNIYFNQYTKTGGWSDASLLEEFESDNSEIPRIAMNSSGDATVVWRQQLGLKWNENTRRYSNGSWLAIEELDNSEEFMRRSSVSMNDSGEILVAWIQRDGIYESAWTKSYLPNSGWQQELVIEAQTGSALYEIQVELNNDSSAIVGWVQANNLWVNTRVNDVWQTEYEFELDGISASADEDEFNIRLTEDNRIAVIWSQDETYISYTSIGEPWIEPVQLSSALFSTSSPDLDIDNNGNIIVVWSEKISASLVSILSKEYKFETTSWSESEIISEEDGFAYQPIIKIDNAGNALSIWRQNGDLFSNRLD